METWKLIPEFEGRYEVSNIGNVRSLLDSHLRPKQPTNKVLGRDLNGYVVVSLYFHRKMFLKKVHRFVAKLFIPNPENKPFVNHKNGIKDDNRVENLEWCTAKENSQHAVATGLHVGIKGEDAGMAIWTNAEVTDIKNDINLGLTTVELFAKYPKLNSKHLYLFRKNKTFNNIEARVTVQTHNVGKRKLKPKMYADIADEILLYKNTNLSQQEVADKFGISQSIVSLIYLNKYK